MQGARQKCHHWEKTTGAQSNLESGEFEEVLLFGHFQQMVLNEGVHLGQKSSVSHGAGKVAEGDGVQGIHFRKQVVATNL